MDTLKRLLGNLLPYLLLLTIGVLAAFSLGPRDLLTQYRLSTLDTAVSLGTVTENVRVRKPKGSRYYLGIRYVVPAGESSRSFEVRRQVERELAGAKPLGSSIRVRYAKDAPAIADVADSDLLRNKGISFLGVCVLLGLLAIVFTGMIRHVRSQGPFSP
ncbi:hypothetical protein J7643_06320 [bacterium]|nr:hypothetical protein [bacterium]